MAQVNEQLSAGERECLEHLRRARELGVSVSRYCRDRDLRFHQLMWYKRSLRSKGVIEPARGGKARMGKMGKFVPVSVVVPSAVSPACRIVHSSGWAIECASYPQVQWLAGLMAGRAP